MEFATQFLPAEVLQAFTAAGYTSKDALCVPKEEQEAFVKHLARKVLGIEDADEIRFIPSVNGLRALLRSLEPTGLEPATEAQPPRVIVKETEDEEEKKRKKRKLRDECREKAKAHFEGTFSGSLWGSDRVAPSDEAFECASWAMGEAPEWHHWCHYTSVEDVFNREAAKRVKKELETKRRRDNGSRKSKDRDESSDDESDKVLKFGGGLWKAQLACEIRRKVVSGKGLVHLEALATYDMNLFDAALRPPPEGLKHPSTDELLKADRAAWEEVARLVRSREASAEAALVHVSKPGGYLWGLIRPEEKSKPKKDVPAAPNPGTGQGQGDWKKWQPPYGKDWKGGNGGWSKESWKGHDKWKSADKPKRGWKSY